MEEVGSPSPSANKHGILLVCSGESSDYMALGEMLTVSGFTQDRFNIGPARIAGMQEALHITDKQVH